MNGAYVPRCPFGHSDPRGGRAEKSRRYRGRGGMVRLPGGERVSVRGHVLDAGTEKDRSQ